MAFVASLKARAAKGDKMAMAELQKLRAIGAQYKAMAIDQAAEHAADEIAADSEEEDDEIAGDEEQAEQIGADKLDQADFIAQKFKNADGLVQKVALRNHGWKGLADVAKFVRTNPPSVMQGTLGGYQVVNTNDVNPIQVVNWGGEDEETLPCTITVAPVQQLGVTESFAIRSVAPYAVIQWGTRAALAKATIDIGRGTQLTVNGSYVTVSVGAEDPTGTGAPTPRTMKIMGMMSFYPCVRTTPITRTQYLTVAPNTSTARIAVPDFAKNVILLPIQPAGDYSIIFCSSNTNGEYTRLVPSTTVMLDPYPLSNDIVSIIVQNGATTLFGRLVFELSL
jgi:hypothetical protein